VDNPFLAIYENLQKYNAVVKYILKIKHIHFFFNIKQGDKKHTYHFSNIGLMLV